MFLFLVSQILGIVSSDFAYLLHYLLYTKNGIVSPNKHIWILPTHNSTLLETTTKPIEVKILCEYSGYYKIITPEEKVGEFDKSAKLKNSLAK